MSKLVYVRYAGVVGLLLNKDSREEQPYNVRFKDGNESRCASVDIIDKDTYDAWTPPVEATKAPAARKGKKS